MVHERVAKVQVLARTNVSPVLLNIVRPNREDNEDAGDGELS